MGWSEIARLILSFGIEGAFKIWEISHKFPDGPTPEAWDALRALSLKSYEEYIADAEKRRASEIIPPPPPAPPS